MRVLCASEPLMGASSSRRGRKRRSSFSGARNRKVPDSNCAQSEPNALADMQPSPALWAPSPSRWARGTTGWSTHSSNHAFTPSARNKWRLRHFTPALSPEGREKRLPRLGNGGGSLLQGAAARNLTLLSKSDRMRSAARHDGHGVLPRPRTGVAAAAGLRHSRAPWAAARPARASVAHALSRNYANGGAPPSRRLPAWPVRAGDSHSLFRFSFRGRYCAVEKARRRSFWTV